jgi:UDP-glucose 4-epimerase
MVYGKGCKGNFQLVVKIVEKMPIFPYIENQRSMIYIDNLSSFVRLCAENLLSGFYFPQNREYVSTVKMAQAISLKLNKKIYIDYATGFLVKVLRPFYPTVRKAFGTLVYKDTEQHCFSYIVVENEESFKKSIS